MGIFFFSVFSTTLSILIGFHFSTSISTKLVEPELIIFTGIGYIFAYLTLHIILVDISYIFKWIGFSLVTLILIIYTFTVFFTPLSLSIKTGSLTFVISVILYLLGGLKDTENKRKYPLALVNLYLVLFLILFVSWNFISFDKFLPVSPVKISFQPISSNISRDFVLKSEMGVDYSKLKNFLSEKKFKDADIETKKAVFTGLQNAEEYEKSLFGKFRQLVSIDSSELLRLTPCQDLLTIDRLWRFYSKGKFGLSLQSEMLSQISWGLQTRYNLFSNLVGWQRDKEPINYDKLTFTDEAPIGHLPYSLNHQSLYILNHQSLFSKFSTCKV